MTEKGACIQFKGELFELIVKGKHSSIGHKHWKLFELDTVPTQRSYFGSCNGNASSVQSSFLLW